MKIQLQSFQCRVTTLVLMLALSLVSIGAGPCTPSKKTIEQTAEAAKDIGGGTRDVIKAVGEAYRKDLITIEQKDRWADLLGQISRGGKQGVEALDVFIKAGLTELPADKAAALNRVFSDGVVAPFLQLIGEIAKLSDAQSAAIRAAIAGLRTTILILSSRIGRNDVINKIYAAPWNPVLAYNPVGKMPALPALPGGAYV